MGKIWDIFAWSIPTFNLKSGLDIVLVTENKKREIMYCSNRRSPLSGCWGEVTNWRHSFWESLSFGGRCLTSIRPSFISTLSAIVLLKIQIYRSGCFRRTWRSSNLPLCSKSEVAGSWGSSAFIDSLYIWCSNFQLTTFPYHILESSKGFQVCCELSYAVTWCWASNIKHH